MRDHVYQHNQTDLEFLRCISVQRWTNTPTSASPYLPQIAAPANQFAVVRCIVNDPEGNVTECFYDARNRCVMEREFTGRATPGVPVTDTVNRPTGKLRSERPRLLRDAMDVEQRFALHLGNLVPGRPADPMRFINPISIRPHPPAKRADLRVVRELASRRRGFGRRWRGRR